MKKREWVRPLTLAQRFEANEYVAACGDSGTVYNFECNATAGTLYYYPTSDGTIDGTYSGSGNASLLGNYSPCGATHEASGTNVFFDGFVDRNNNRRCDSGEEVIVWIEYNNRGQVSNAHATTNLDMTSWSTAKS